MRRTLVNYGESNQRNEEIMWNHFKKTSICFVSLTASLLATPVLALTVYTDSAAFAAANPGLTTEDFETNNLGASTSKVCPSPLDFSSDNTCFSPNNLATGVEYGLPDNPVGTELALEATVDSLTSRIGANSVSDFLVARFSDSNTTAVGLELICTFSPRAGTVRFYGVNGLISEQAVACTATGDFIAIAGDEAIVRIEAEAPGTFESVDNVMFGNATIFSVYTDRAGFESMYPILSKEDFEAGDLGGSGSRACPSPLDSNSSNDCFSPGDLAAGVQFSIQSNPLIPQLALSGPKPGRTITLGANGFSDYTVIRFSDLDTTAVGLELYCFTSPGSANVRFFSVDGLITDQVIDCSANAKFIAINANKTIIRVETEQIGQYEFMDNLMFGRAASQLMFTDGFE